MLRKENEIKELQKIEEIINNAQVCRVAFSDNNIPYIVPFSFGYETNAIYLHCAKKGRKIDILEKNNNVCFEFDVDVKVTKGEHACNWSMSYKSVIGFGKAELIDEFEEKIHGLSLIMSQYSGKLDFNYKESTVNRTAIIKITIDSMTGKQA